MLNEKNIFSFLSNIKFTFQLSKRYCNKILVFMPILFILRAYFNFGWCFISKFIIDLATDIYSIPTNKLLLILLGITIISILLEILRNYIDSENTWLFGLISFNIIKEINKKILTTKYQNFDSPAFLDLITKATNTCSTNTGVEGMLDSFFSILMYLFNTGIGITILGYNNAILLLFLLITTALNAICYNLANKYIKFNIWDPFTPIYRKINYFNDISRDFSFGKEIRMLNLKNFIVQKQKELFKLKIISKKKEQRIWLIITLFTSFINQGCHFIVYFWLIKQIIVGTLTISNFTLALSSFSVIKVLFSAFLNEATSIFARNREINDLRKFLSSTNEKQPEYIPIPKTKDYILEFKNVSFKYPNSNSYTLKNINLIIQSKEKLALVGPNGAGKTTLIKLIMRLYDPTEGTILLNGIDIHSFELNEYYKLFAPIFQDFSIFAFPIYENISLKDKNDTDFKKIEEAIKYSGLSEKISQLKKGIESQLLKILHIDGIDLSGGEKQKISLSRAIYKGANFYIFDEPTASFDALSESKIFKQFNEISQDKTSIFISHRLSSTKFCDKVLYFSNGQICEYGTHKELINMNGEYAKMFTLQAKDYKNEK